MDGPSVPCPDCGSGLTDVERFTDREKQPGPGEHALYRCGECGWLFGATVPEPSEEAPV